LKALSDFCASETDEAPSIPSLPKDRQSLFRHLEKTNPEALALARDWDDTVWALMNTQKKIAQSVFLPLPQTTGA
jgi:U3 small nucleolar RNA-associated protein 3